MVLESYKIQDFETNIGRRDKTMVPLCSFHRFTLSLSGILCGKFVCRRRSVAAFKVPGGSGGALPSNSDREPAPSPAGTED